VDAAAARWAERLRHPFRSWTLRRRLVLAVIAILAVLGVVIGLISVLFLNGYLLDRLDGQLRGAAERGVRQALSYSDATGNLPVAGDLVAGPGQTQGTFVAYLADGQVSGTPSVLSLGSHATATTPTVSSDYRSLLVALPDDATPTTVDLGGNLGEYRLIAKAMPGDRALVLGLPLTEVRDTTGQLWFIIMIVTVATLFVAAGVGLLIVRLALRPLDRVAAAATEVSELPLDRGEVALAVRVPESDTDARTEVGRVGASFNRMLGHVASALTARQASENKVRQFVADASHELRTPLASIRGYAELTRRAPEALPEETVRALGRIESEAGRMTGLVEDLLLLARLDEGRALDHEPVDLSRIVVDAVSDAHAAGRDHRWSVDLPPEPVTVLGDEPRLHQIVVNLLANARVHTPEGTAVTVTLAVDDAAAVMTVADDGPGIPAELQPVLFERFARGDSSRSRETGSTGLGLAIVRAVVDALGGTVAVDSEPGSTAFIVRLPLA
jgi:two-component system OmpR family sensor kinase